MRVFSTKNFHTSLPTILSVLKVGGLRQGDYKVFCEPVAIVCDNPLERNIFWKDYQVNPFEDFMNMLWMFKGSASKDFPERTGHRWRVHFGEDQLEAVCAILNADVNDQRAVLSVWDASVDGLGRKGGYAPCEMEIVFTRGPEGQLDMTVMSRSYNIITDSLTHLSYLHEFMFKGSKFSGVGKLTYITTSAFCLQEDIEKVLKIDDMSMDPYSEEEMTSVPFINTDMVTWHQDLAMFLAEGPVIGLRDKFFRKVVVPIYLAAKAFNEGAVTDAKDNLCQCADAAWRKACWEWVEKQEETDGERPQEATGRLFQAGTSLPETVCL